MLGPPPVGTGAVLDLGALWLASQSPIYFVHRAGASRAPRLAHGRRHPPSPSLAAVGRSRPAALALSAKADSARRKANRLRRRHRLQNMMDRRNSNEQIHEARPLAGDLPAARRRPRRRSPLHERRWILSDEPAKTGDAGLKICLLWPTARHGERQYRDGVGNKYRDVQLYIDGAPPDERIELGWEPLTQLQAIAQDEAHVGQVVTYTSFSWGGRNAFENLIGDYLSKGGQQFPVVALDVRPKRNDPNRNIDPVFRIVGWKAADDFADVVANILPQPAPLALEPPTRAEPESFLRGSSPAPIRMTTFRSD